MKKLLLLLFIPLLLAEEKIDLYTVNRIKTEAFENSKVMDYVFHLTEVVGPRLTGSPAYGKAADWAVESLKELGLKNARLESWGPYGRGWENLRFYGAITQPAYQPLIGVPRPLALGTEGKVSGEAMLAVIRTDADMEKFKGKLKGKIVLSEEMRPVPMETEPLGRRYTDADLAQTALALIPGPRQTPANREGAQKLRNRISQFLKDEGVLVAVSPSMTRGDGGTVFSSAAGSRELKDPVPPASVALAVEHYNRIARLIEKKVPVTLEFDIENKIYDQPVESFNVIAELPGASRNDEVLMIGAHLDSWSYGTGATDNAAGCAVMLEALRILKALDLKTARTLRIGLWSAEEQGLLGSAAWVNEHLADRETMALKPEHAKMSGYFNLDNGGGKIRGVYLQGNDMMRPLFEAWLVPFRDLGAGTITTRNTSGTDHLSFDAVGIPAFQFVQDPLEYMTRTHHSNMDVYDRLQSQDLMQASAIVASLVYTAANREEMLPRRPLPKPRPRTGLPAGQ